jgi:hypothetical protein
MPGLVEAGITGFIIGVVVMPILWAVVASRWEKWEREKRERGK